MVAMKRTVLALSLLWVLAGTAPASAAFLVENPRLGESFPNTTFLRVSADVSRELLLGSGGSCLERPAECFVAPNNPLQNEINALEKEVADQQQFAENWRNALDNAVERGQPIDPQDAAGVRRAFDKLDSLKGVLENLKSVPQN